MNKVWITLATLIALFAPQAFAQQELTLKTQYKGGASVKSSYFGISLTIPQGFAGAYTEEGGKRGFVMTTPDGNMAFILLFQHGVAFERYESQLMQPFPVGKFTLEPQGNPNRQGNLVVVQTADANNGISGISVATVGNNNTSVLMVGLTVAGQEQPLIAKAEAILGSFKYFKGQIASADAKAKNTWTAQLSGKIFFRNGGAGFNQSQNGSVSDNSETRLTLCRDGQYEYASRSITSVSIPGGDGLSSSSSSSSNGTWAVETVTQTAVILVLTDEFGAQLRVQLVVQGNTVRLDGQAVGVGQGGC